jgi:hypothetical protein
VAQASRTDERSSYYPPRSRWYSRIFSRAEGSARAYLQRRRLYAPAGLGPGFLILTLVVPGLAFFLLGRRILGCVLALAYALAAVVFVVKLGFPAASIAYGLLISLHSTSIIFLEGQALKDSGLGMRLAVGAATTFVVWGLIYAPLVDYAERHWCMPLNIGGRVVVVQCKVAPQSIKRGDWLAYRISGDHYVGEGEQGVFLGSGIQIDPVLALPGDRMRFTPNALFVNDQPLPRAPRMPAQGEFVVPEKVWFVWPNLGITGGGRVAEANISETLQRTAMVSQNAIIGRPFQSWFGRRQWP